MPAAAAAVADGRVSLPVPAAGVDDRSAAVSDKATITKALYAETPHAPSPTGASSSTPNGGGEITMQDRSAANVPWDGLPRSNPP
jgi:hypothetical protein